jgi:hypothetical protein
MTVERHRTYLVVDQRQVIARIEGVSDDPKLPPYVVLVEDDGTCTEYFDQTLENVVDSVRQYYPGCLIYRAYVTRP